MHGHGKKNLDFELNLIPFIDLLSVCICFLLLTAVWIQVGSMEVKQAVGGQAAAETTKKPTLWVHLSAAGDLNLDLQDAGRVPARLRKALVKTQEGQPNLKQFSTWLESVKAVEPSLSTALIQPKVGTTYEKIIDVMDQLKKNGLTDLGVVPL